jgi:predicted RNA-binding protein with TRAM domain
MGFGSEGSYRQGGFRPSFRQDSFREPPVKVGEEYDLEITDVAKKGDGIAKVEGFIIFVANARKGDKVHVRIAEVKNRFAVGEVSGASSGSAPAASTEEVSEETEDGSDEEAQ